jgi:FkbM family methyltransferase
VTRQHHKELIPILRPLLPADGVVLDVGAHAGQMARLFAGMMPRGRVHAFEPGAYALAVLRAAVALRGRGRIAIEPIGLGARPDRLVLTTPIKRSGSYGFGLSNLGNAAAGDAVRHEVRVDTVDNFVARSGLRRVDFIKADIEGWEMQMLLGAERTLTELRPVLLLEMVDAQLARAGNSHAGLWRFLIDRRYQAHRLEAGLPRFTPAADGDVVWVPAERAGSMGLR